MTDNIERLRVALLELQGAGYTAEHVERAFSMPAASISMAGTDDVSAAIACSLVQCVLSYPWLLEVAGNDFDRDTAHIKLVEAADTFKNR